MKGFLFTTLTAALMTATATQGALAQTNPAPAGECTIYESESYYTLGSSNWSYGGNMGHQVCFEDGKLYLNKICGNGWTIGELAPDGKSATFASGQQVADDTFLNAYVKIDGRETPIDQFTMTISDNRDRLTVDPVDGNNVILVLEYTSGYVGTKWMALVMTRWTLEAPCPTPDATITRFQMDYTDAYNTVMDKTVEIARSDNGKVWVSGLVRDGIWMEGTTQPNGDILFETPQYMGLLANFFTYTYATDVYGNQAPGFTLVAGNDGTYTLQEGITLNEGEEAPGYPVLIAATLTPAEINAGTPVPPYNAAWDAEQDHFFTFELDFMAIDGQPLKEDDLYWQVLANGEPYVFTKADYPLLAWSGLADSSELPANKYFTVLTPDGPIGWGNLDGHKFGCYLPAYAAGDDIQLRVAYKDGAQFYWSETVAVADNRTFNQLPREALYYSRVAIPMAQWDDTSVEGYAVNTEFGTDTMLISGLMFQYGWVEGTFDTLHRKATFATGQVIGQDEYGNEVTLMAALSQGYDQNGTLLFAPCDTFTLKISEGGEKITMDGQTYLLSVCQGMIVNVWKYSMSFTAVADQVPAIPEDAIRTAYMATYLDRLGAAQETNVTIAQQDGNVWLQNIAGPGTVIAARADGDDIIIDTPQFIGVVRNMISYLTAESTNYLENSITLHTEDSGNTYTAQGDFWIGTGSGYAWLSNMNLVLTRDIADQVGSVAKDKIEFADGSFKADAPLRVFNLSGMEVDNRNLSPGIYLVRLADKTVKMGVK